MLKIFFNKKFSLVITLSLMMIIFYFSHQTGQESSQMSNNLWIRKLAHITEYAILSFFVYAHVTNYKNIQSTSFVSGLVTILYAASDEYHQTFIVGRSGNVIDAFIDSIGVIIGVLIANYFAKKIVI